LAFDLVASAVKTWHITIICAATSLSTFETKPARQAWRALTLRGFVEVLPRLKDKRTAVEM
jgi:hypothetical protein